MYFNSKQSNGSSLIWDKIQQWMTMPREQYVDYGVEGLSVFHALRDYPVNNMSGLVIGSQTPWVEVLALKSGARENIEISERENFSNIDSFDFVISFSSLEHSGLGRYGDKLDPIGDLREVLKTLCVLKKGGIFIFATHRGQDGLAWNAHRTYGRIRLAMIMAGFEWLDTYRGFSPYPLQPTRDELELENSQVQDLFVLRKL
ncbi:unnamed protein product [Nippostrongylus brasiliensis]|uniref:Methyltransf_11 domain-containing protein n=1 Tax=Nippostrongylus brasiliensis TaxID=27835 RepID=A0A0N4Y934_NIPBR|nr:unnamed protein product [Nippostrongylus brasiliensis]